MTTSAPKAPREIKAEAESLKKHNLTYLRNLLSDLLQHPEEWPSAATIVHIHDLLDDIDKEPLPENRKWILRAPLGRDHESQKLMAQIPYIARSDANTLIKGATGTGKGSIAELIHLVSGKNPNRFARLNLAGYPYELAWGHVAGHTADAFTGANFGTLGSYCLAHDGTLFIDEFDDIAPEIQMLFLDIAQRSSKRLRRLGANAELLQEIKSGFLKAELIRNRKKTKKEEENKKEKKQPDEDIDKELTAIIEDIAAKGQPNVRLLFGLSQNIQEKVEKGIFRVDLYYRINVLPINLPKLCDRKIDFAALIGLAISDFGKNKEIKGFSPRLYEKLSQCSWPGDVRQLRNVIEAAIAYAKDGIIDYHDWFDDVMANVHPIEAGDIKRLSVRSNRTSAIKIITEVLNKRINAAHSSVNFRKTAKIVKDEYHCDCSDTTIKNMIKKGEIKFQNGQYIAPP